MVTGHRSSLVPAIPIRVLSLQACGTTDAGSGDVNSEWTATTDTIGDTIRVFTEHGQIWESDARLVSEVSIGVLDGDPQYQFGNTRAIAVGADGRELLPLHAARAVVGPDARRKVTARSSGGLLADFIIAAVSQPR